MRRLFFRIATLLVISVSAYRPAAASDVLLVHDAHESYNLFQHSSFFADKTDSLSVAQVLQLAASDWQPAASLDTKSWGFSPHALWVKIKLTNLSSRRQWYIGSQRPDLSVIDMYLYQGGQRLAHQQTGAHVPLNDRPTASRLPFAPFTVPPATELTLLVRMKSPLQIILPLYAHPPSAFEQINNRANYSIALYCGTIGSLIIYNFILFVLLRYVDYFFYCLFGLSMALNALSQSGSFEILNLGPIFTGIDDTHLVICGPPIMGMIYTRSFLRLRTIAPKLDAILRIVIGLGIILAILIMTPLKYQLLPLVSWLNATCLVAVFTGSLVASRKKDPAAYAFSAAWGILAVSVGVWILGNTGVIEKTFLIAFSPLFGNMVEMILMSIALAIRIKLLDRQKQAAELKAQESEQLKKLLRVVCHDISNPLSVITGATWIANKKRETSQDTYPLWDRVERASLSIEEIIQQVKRYESIRSGKASLQVEPTRVDAVFEELQFFFKPQCEAKQLELRFQLDPQHPDLLVMADKVSLVHEIMSNLLSNAVKFTPAGGSITVSVQLQAHSGMVRLRVQDSGIGIPGRLLEQIFDPQAQTSRAGTNAERGTGFGMPLVKTYVENFGGYILLHSVEKDVDKSSHGTTADVFLPLAGKSPRYPRPVDNLQRPH